MAKKTVSGAESPSQLELQLRGMTAEQRKAFLDENGAKFLASIDEQVAVREAMEACGDDVSGLPSLREMKSRARYFHRLFKPALTDR
jgi:hypothetical protein